jgi:hypothetical protein
MCIIKHRLWQIFSEDSDDSLCVAKVLAVIAFVAYLVYSGYGLFTGHFVLEEFSRGLMETLVGSAAVIAGKQMTQKS